VQPLRRAGKLVLTAWVIAVVVAFFPIAAAAGSGYSLNFSQSPGQSSDAAVDLIALSTTDPGGAQITTTFQVSGTLNLHDSNFDYTVYFGGSGSSSGNYASAIFSNDSQGTWISGSSGGSGYGSLPYTVGSGGSSLTFSMNKTAVGPAATFAVNAFAADSNSGASWIGSDYSGGPGGTCTGTNCVTTATANAVLWLWLSVAIIVVVVVVVLVVVLLVMRRKRTPPMAGQPMMVGSPPPPPPPASP